MDFQAVGAPQGAGYGSGLMNFGLSGQPQPNPQQPQPGQPNQQQQNPAYSLGQGIGQWLRQYFQQQQGQPGAPTNITPGPQDATAPDINPSGPWGKAADDRRAWDAMIARQNQSRADGRY